jgi:hypothetical protein
MPFLLTDDPDLVARSLIRRGLPRGKYIALPSVRCNSACRCGRSIVPSDLRQPTACTDIITVDGEVKDG